MKVVRDTRLYDAVWPADLNNDGITDLVSTSALTCGGGACNGGQVQVALGKGDGTFNAPVLSNEMGIVLGTGDFNNDKKTDVIVASTASQSRGATFILPGTGTATLGTPRIVWTQAPAEFYYAVSADFDGDGNRDLVRDGGDGLLVFPGNGDFTFDTPVSLPTGVGVHDALVVDIDGDGKRDIVTANYYGRSLTLLRNKGGFVFTSTDIALGAEGLDVTAADVNSDGRIDLLASTGRLGDPSTGTPDNGEVYVLLGTGGGAFGPPVAHTVLPSPAQIVVGDFNRDGRLDIATGNRSSIIRDDCADTFKTWDSVSILPNLGGGNFGAAWNFSIGDQNLNDPSDANHYRYRNTLVSLNTSDLNRDGATDLIASHGALLFNIVPPANRPPVADAGPDAIIPNTHEAVLRFRASDPDNDVLRWEIRDDTGRIVDIQPTICVLLHDGDNRFTVTVDDGHGHVSSDSVVYTPLFSSGDGTSGQFGGSSDIGRVAAAGSDSYDSTTDTYTVRGSGADIWGTADEFHYMWTLFDGDFQITTRVDSVQNVNVWTKAGLMIRENLHADARHVSLFATPGKSVAFQARPTTGGISVNTSVYAGGAPITAPVWLKLARHGDSIAAFWRQNATSAWEPIGAQVLSNLGPNVVVGLAVTSHADGRVATATFSHAAIHRPMLLTGRVIGSAAGQFTGNAVKRFIDARGADIWGTADAFVYGYLSTSNDGTVTTQVTGLGGASGAPTNAWAKAGVMFRESLAANARQVMVVVTPGKGVAMQYRPATGGASFQAANVPGVVPMYLRLRKNGTTFTGQYSKNGDTWTTLATVSVTLPSTFDVGVAATSHDPSNFVTAVFEEPIYEP